MHKKLFLEASRAKEGEIVLHRGRITHEIEWMKYPFGFPQKRGHVMIRGKDEVPGRNFAATFDLKLIGKGRGGLAAEVFVPEIELEISCDGNPPLPGPVDIHEVVVEEDVISALPGYVRRGYSIVSEPFDISMGKCAIVQDASGTRLCLFERTLPAYQIKAVGMDGAAIRGFLP